MIRNNRKTTVFRCFDMTLIAAFLLILISLLSGCEKEVESRLTSDLPDFESISVVEEKKRKFFEFLSPYIIKRNTEIKAKRKKLLGLYDKHFNKKPLTVEEKNWLYALADEYKIDVEEVEPATLWILLLRRVDTVPVDLALIQAAKESGWGTSRFAREGYNLYGQQCFKAGCGIVPQARGDDAVHEVKKFESVYDSVYSYIRNLNTGDAYHDFRTIRFTIRENGRVPDGYSLIPGLPLYSERRDEYLTELQEMILANREYIGS